MKRVVTFLLLAVLGAAVPVAARGDSDNDAARRAAMKHNAHRSHKDARQTKHAAMKQSKRMHSKNHKKDAKTQPESLPLG